MRPADVDAGDKKGAQKTHVPDFPAGFDRYGFVLWLESFHANGNLLQRSAGWWGRVFEENRRPYCKTRGRCQSNRGFPELVRDRTTGLRAPGHGLSPAARLLAKAVPERLKSLQTKRIFMPFRFVVLFVSPVPAYSFPVRSLRNRTLPSPHAIHHLSTSMCPQKRGGDDRLTNRRSGLVSCRLSGDCAASSG